MGITMGNAVNGTCYLVKYPVIYQRSKAIVAVGATFSNGALYVSVVAYFVMDLVLSCFIFIASMISY